jgi:hypothetical protein
MRTRHLALVLPLFAAIFPTRIAAQTAAPANDAPHILIDTVGPDGWRMRLGPTNLGSMLESEKGHALWEPRMMPILEMWQQMLGDEAAYAATRTRVLGYGGRIQIGIWILPESPDRAPEQQIAVVFDGDGRTDLDALAEDLRMLQNQTPEGAWEERVVDGSKVTTRTHGDSAMTAPLHEGNHVVIAIGAGETFGTALARGRALASSATGKAPAPNSPALRVQVDFPAIVRLTASNTAGFERALMKVFGVDSLGQGSLTVGTAGPRVMFEVAQQFTSDERGLFGAFFPASTTIPGLLQAAPGGKESWKVGHFDATAAYQTIESAILAEEHQSSEELRAKMKEELGIDLLPDLFAHMTDEVMMTGAIHDRNMEETTWSLTFRLRDQAAFDKGLFTLLAHGKPMITRAATEKHGDIEVHRYGNFIGYDTWIAVGNGVFTIAGGRDAEETIGGILDRCKTLPKDAAATAAPSSFDTLKKFLPQGNNGLAIGDIGSLASLPSEMWLELLHEFVPIPRSGSGEPATEEEQEAMQTMLREHQLDTMRSATGYADRRWSWRLFW